MKLDVYRRKRDFGRTPEPRGRTASHTANRFVIQKHDARRLHYDFRLELNGTLKSWAVPKGPSLDPRERRLAVHVEDHPIEYGKFEGTIPKPGYGAGAVLVWDRGTWTSEGDPDEGYRRGRLHFKLDGEKLRGGWTLVRTQGADDKDQWLLIKSDDEYASKLDIVDALPDSVQSGRSLDDVRANRARGKRRPSLPALLRPQLATLVDAPPEGPEWMHEIKYDGYRVLCRVDDGSAELYSRNGNKLTRRMAAVARAIEHLPGLKSGWLDGEVVALQSDGRTSFSALQQALSDGRDRDLIYYLFDLPYYNGADLTAEPLRARKARLAAVLSTASSGPIRYSDHVQGDGSVFHRQACDFGLEGVVSKRADAPYRSGRTHDWLKSKWRMRQEFVIGGYTEPGGTRKGIGALLLGVYDDDGRLQYSGRIGTGFDDAMLVNLHRRLQRLRTDTSPFAERLPAEARRGTIHWVRPQTVIDVEFAGWTHDGMVRQGSFQGIREDKSPREVTRERPVSLARAAGSPARTKAVPRASARLTHPDKVLYPEQGLTKRDLALYYEAVADWFLPHAKDRPLTLVRCPEGRQKKCFFQKHAAEGTPPAIRRVPILEDDGTRAIYLAINSLDGVLALVQMDVLEIHVWGARIDRPDYPDRLVFDLDPDPAVSWDEVVATAHLTRKRLADLGLVSFARTTGGKGLHVIVPLVRRRNWDEAKTFAKALAEDLVRQNPERYTARLPLAARRGKIFIDYLRNGRGATAITNYSTRARPNATVAVPVRWEEVQASLRPDRYTIMTVPGRLQSLRRDPWADFSDVRQTLTQRMRRELGLR